MKPEQNLFWQAVLILILVGTISISGCVSKEQQELKTEVRAGGGDMEMFISPSNGSVINGVVTINITKVPTGTNIVAFVIQGPGIEDLQKTGPNLGIDTDGSDGWGAELDTGTYPDGRYKIYGFAGFVSSLENLGNENNPPLGVAMAKVEIRNPQEELKPPEIGFYKAVQIWPTLVSKEKILKAKNMGASVVGFLITTRYENNTLILSEDWDIRLKSEVRQAHRNGLAVSVGVLFPEGIDKKFPYREGSDIDLPPGYDLAPFTANLKEVYKEVAIFSEENKVHDIGIPLEIEAWIGRVYENSGEYWAQSSKINQEVTKEIRKYYTGDIVGSILGGAWGFDTPCCYTNVPVSAINISMFDAILMPTSSDYRITGSTLGYVDEGLKRIEFTRKVMSRNNVNVLYVGVGGYPLISPWKGDRIALYSEFFEKSQGKVEGYSVGIPVEAFTEIYDNKSFEAAKIWYRRI